MRRKTAPSMEQSVTSNWISFAFFRFVMTYAWLNSSSKLKLVFIDVMLSSYPNELGLFSPWWCKVVLSYLVLSSALFRKRFSFNAIRLVNQNHKEFTSGDCKNFFNFWIFKIFLFVTETREVTNHFKLLFGTVTMKSDGVTWAKSLNLRKKSPPYEIFPHLTPVKNHRDHQYNQVK